MKIKYIFFLTLIISCKTTEQDLISYDIKSEIINTLPIDVQLITYSNNQSDSVTINSKSSWSNTLYNINEPSTQFYYFDSLKIYILNKSKVDINCSRLPTQIRIDLCNKDSINIFSSEYINRTIENKKITYTYSINFEDSLEAK